MTPLRIGLLTVPCIDENATASVLALLKRHQIVYMLIHEAAAASQRNWIEEILCRWSDEDELDLIMTIGGTLPASGPGQLECVPEVTLAVAERLLPGFSEAMRAHACKQTPLALLDRSVSAIRGRTLLLNLPAGAASATLFLEAVVELIPGVIAHLREDASAPIMENELELVEDDADLETSSTAETAPQKGLKAEEFAEFLQRRTAK